MSENERYYQGWSDWLTPEQAKHRSQSIEAERARLEKLMIQPPVPKWAFVILGAILSLKLAIFTLTGVP